MRLYCRSLPEDHRRRYAAVEALKIGFGGIAHEMRNPLGQVRHQLNRIGHELPAYHPDRPAESLDEWALDQLYQGVAHGQMAVKRGVQIIDMILDQVHDKPIDPDRFVYLSAARTTQKVLDEYGYDSPTERERVHLGYQEDFDFRGDETLYLFVLFNLLKTAKRPSSGCVVKYDLILMDLNMPEMNGYEATERLRAGDGGRHGRTTPIVAHTSEPPYIAQGKTEKVGMQGLVPKPCTGPEQIREAREAGMDDYLVKPIDQAVLLRKLEEWLSPTPGEASPQTDEA